MINEADVVDQLMHLLRDLEEICVTLGLGGRFQKEPMGRCVVGSPNFIWIPHGATHATLCIVVESPGQLSTWDSAKPLDPPYSHALDVVNLCDMKENLRVKTAMRKLSAYMQVRVARGPDDVKTSQLSKKKSG